MKHKISNITDVRKRLLKLSEELKGNEVEVICKRDEPKLVLVPVEAFRDCLHFMIAGLMFQGADGSKNNARVQELQALLNAISED